MSLAVEICRIAEDQVGKDVVGSIREVGLLVGLDSGVEPESLDFCLDVLLSEPPFTGARVCMEFEEGADLRVTYLEVEDGGPPH